MFSASEGTISGASKKVRDPALRPEPETVVGTPREATTVEPVRYQWAEMETGMR